MVDVLLTYSYHPSYDSRQIRKRRTYRPLGMFCAAYASRTRDMLAAGFDSTLVKLAEECSKALDAHRPRIVAVYEDDFNFPPRVCLTRLAEVAAEIAMSTRSTRAVTIAHGFDRVSSDVCDASAFVFIQQPAPTLEV